MARDPDVASALRCIRYGACAHVCPPFGVVGGEAFGHVDTGPIGLVNTGFHHGLAAAAGPQSLCASCARVCPVDIPLPVQILEVRRTVREAAPLAAPAERTTALAIAAFKRRRLVGAAMTVAGVLLAGRQRDGVTDLPRLVRRGLLRTATSWRSPPAVPRRPARDLLRRGDVGEPPRLADGPLAGRTVQLFLQCLADRLAPTIPVAVARLLRAAGAEVVVPRRQHCCGLPAYEAGLQDDARDLARRTFSVLAGTDDVVTPAPSCLAMLGCVAPHLLRGDVAEVGRAEQLAGRTYDLVGYLTRGPGRLPAGSSTTVTAPR